MTEHAEHIARLASVPTEIEASIIVAALKDNGIGASTVGEATAGFRAEAPGLVQVLVTEEDLSQAKALLEKLREEQGEIDWSQVDVGEPEENE